MSKKSPVQILTDLLCDNLCSVNIHNVQLIKQLFDALHSDPQRAKELAGDLETKLMDQLENWNEQEQETLAKRDQAAQAKSMFQGDVSTDQLQANFQQQRAIWALIACGELVKAYPPCEDRPV